MKKLLGLLTFCLIMSAMAPACSTADSFEEVVMESDLDSSYMTDEEGGKHKKPGS